MVELDINELQQISGNGIDFGAAGAGGSLGVAAAATFSVGYAIGGFLVEHTMIDEFIAEVVFDLFN